MAPIILFIFILTPDLGEPMLASFKRAAREVLGTEAELYMRTINEPISDEQAIALAGNASGVVELVWSGKLRVKMHFYLADERRWVDRTITFSPSDPNDERGRVLGFAVASMFDEAAPPADPVSEARESITDEPSGQRAVPSDSFLHERRADQAQSDGIARALEFSGVATTGLGGSAETVGVNAALRFGLAGPYWARIGISARTGEIGAADASSKTALLSLGAGYSLWPRSSGLNLGFRADFLAGWYGVSHRSEQDLAADRASRELLGADLLAQLSQGLGSTVEVFAVLGLEASFGMTDIYAHGRHVATVPVLRALGELGFRSDF